MWCSSKGIHKKDLREWADKARESSITEEAFSGLFDTVWENLNILNKLLSCCLITFLQRCQTTHVYSSYCCQFFCHCRFGISSLISVSISKFIQLQKTVCRQCNKTNRKPSLKNKKHKWLDKGSLLPLSSFQFKATTGNFYKNIFFNIFL